MLASITALQAQNVNINNNVWGDVYVKVYAYQTASCTTFVDSSVLTLAPAGSTTLLDLSIPTNWASGSLPTGTYDIVWATIERDASCPGSPGWGTIVGTCWLGGNEHYDQAIAGDIACGYNTHACVTVMITGSGCSGFFAGDHFQIDFIPGGSNATIDVNW